MLLYGILIQIFHCVDLHKFVSFICLKKSNMIMLFPSSTIQNFIPKMMSEWLIEMGKICPKDKNLPVWPAWPTVILSEDDPPAFPNRNSSPDRDGHYDFEKWLGCYCWENKQITIWIKGVQAVSEDLKLPYLDLFNCVLIHELGHWFNHLAPVFHTEKKEWIEWPEDAIESYKQYPSYHEVWAQLFCWLYGHDKDSGVLAVFEALEKKQSSPYKAWRRLVSEEEEPRARSYEKDELIDFLGRAKDFGEKLYYILESLPWSRSYGKNACFDEIQCGAMLLDYPPYLRTKGIRDALKGDLPSEEDISDW